MHKSNSAGFSLVELIMAVVLTGVIAGGVLLVSSTTTGAIQSGNTVGELDSIGRRVLGDLAERLRASSRDVVDPLPAPPFHTSEVDYQIAVGVVDGETEWGAPQRIELQYTSADPDDGVDNDGDGLVDECRLVWIENDGLPDERAVTLCNSVREYLEGESEGGDDENGNQLRDERGFCLTFEDSKVTIRLTLERIDAGGFRIARSFERTASFRHREEPTE